MRYHWSIYRYIAVSLVNLSWSYSIITYQSIVIILLSLVNLSLVNLSLSYGILLVNLSYSIITCQSIVIILQSITCQSIVIILRITLSIVVIWHYYLSIYRYHIALSLVNLSWSYSIITYQSIVIILRYHLSIYRDHIASLLINLSSLFCQSIVFTCVTS